MGRYLLGSWGILTGLLGGTVVGKGASSIPFLSDEHHQCPGPSVLPWTFLHRWAGSAVGAIPGTQRPGSKGEHGWGPGDIHEPGIKWIEPSPHGGLFVPGLVNHLPFPDSPYLLPDAGCPPALAWFCAGLWSSRKKRDPWLQEPTVPLIERRKF